MDYKEEFERLLDTAKQAANSSFKSQAANAILEEAIEYYENLETPEQRIEAMQTRIDNLERELKHYKQVCRNITMPKRRYS